MDKLREQNSLEFHMVYHVPSEKFEHVEILKCDDDGEGNDREVIGQAKFTTQAANRAARGGSPPARAVPATNLRVNKSSVNNKASTINKVNPVNRGKSVGLSGGMR